MENQNQNPKTQLIERLKESNNVLVTVSNNPSVDQLSAAIGFTLFLNHLGKHATAVYSGKTPNTLEFLKPEDTIEKNTDSLRDFIISLDKSKADKLRYKVEDKMVKIFITPYRTSLSDADLVFGQGDFNVDAVVAIGVQEKEDLDQAITSHGRILHDATVVTVNTTTSGQLGAINWVDAKASSLSEMLVPVCEALKPSNLDAQMATAFLTGIVAETDRFSNEKTSSDTMNVSAKLMSAGANQQLVATQLEQAPEPEAPVSEEDAQIAEAEDAVIDALSKDGSLRISHNPEEITPTESTDVPADASLPIVDEASENETPQIIPDTSAESASPDGNDEGHSRLIMQPPSMGGTLTANTNPEGLDPSTDPMTVKPVDAPILTHNKSVSQPLPEPELPELEDVPFPQTVVQDAHIGPVRSEAPEEPLPVAVPNEPAVPDAPAVVPQEPVSEPTVPAAPDEPLKPYVLPPEPPEPAVSELPGVPPEPAPAALPPLDVPSSEPVDTQTLTDLEQAVDSPHVVDDGPALPPVPGTEPIAPAPEPPQSSEAASTDMATPDPAAALAAAHEALNAGDEALPRPAAFNASAPMDVPHEEPDTRADIDPTAPKPVAIDPTTGQLSYPTNLVPPSPGLPADPTAAQVDNPIAPPPVPPPMAMPPLGSTAAPFPQDGSLPPVPPQ